MKDEAAGLDWAERGRGGLCDLGSVEQGRFKIHDASLRLGHGTPQIRPGDAERSTILLTKITYVLISRQTHFSHFLLDLGCRLGIGFVYYMVGDLLAIVAEIRPRQSSPGRMAAGAT